MIGSMKDNACFCFSIGGSNIWNFLKSFNTILGITAPVTMFFNSSFVESNFNRIDNKYGWYSPLGRKIAIEDSITTSCILSTTKICFK